jgi:hypothetical protein
MPGAREGALFFVKHEDTKTRRKKKRKPSCLCVFVFQIVSLCLKTFYFCLYPPEIFKDMNKENKKQEKDFDTVAFFRSIKEKMAKATEGMTLHEKQNYWRLLREGKVKLM